MENSLFLEFWLAMYDSVRFRKENRKIILLNISNNYIPKNQAETFFRVPRREDGTIAFSEIYK